MNDYKQVFTTLTTLQKKLLFICKRYVYRHQDFRIFGSIDFLPKAQVEFGNSVSDLFFNQKVGNTANRVIMRRQHISHHLLK